MADGPHILIVEARFYDDIADELFEGAKAVIEAAGGTYDRVQVPGVFEIPTAVSIAVEGTDEAYDGYVALGCVIRGETSHYDVVANESARALMDLAVAWQLATGNGILTVDTRKQAEARAARNGKNKGGDAANACLALLNVKRKFGLADSR